MRRVLVVTDDTTTQATGTNPRPAATVFEGSFLSAAALRRDLANTRPAEVLIVSGKYGLLHDADVIAPYVAGEASEAGMRRAVASLHEVLAAGDGVPILLLKSGTLDLLLSLPNVTHPGPVFFVGVERYAERIRAFFGLNKTEFYAFRRVGVARIDARARREIVERLGQVGS